MATAHRILIVDDHPDAAEITASLLHMCGHECRAVTCGTDALEAASEFDYDIALLDLGLPDISGWEVARELRRRQRSHPVVLIAVSAWSAPEDRARSREAGFDHHVAKPADGKKLRTIVELADQELQDIKVAS